MSVIERMKAPTPKGYRKLRNIGLALAAVGGVIVSSPVSLPLAVLLAGQYLIIAGSVASAVAQSVVD